MSKLQVDEITNSTGTGSPVFTYGAPGETNIPLRIYATVPANSSVNISPVEVKDTLGIGRVAPPLANAVNTTQFTVVTTINFQTGVTTPSGNISITFPTSTAGDYRRLGLSYNASTGVVTGTFSSAVTAFGDLANVGSLFVANQRPIGWLDLQSTGGTGYKTAGSSTSIIENSVAGTPRIHNFWPASAALSVQGTVDQVIASQVGSVVTLSTPQSIAVTSTPSFAGIIINGSAQIGPSGAGAGVTHLLNGSLLTGESLFTPGSAGVRYLGSKQANLSIATTTATTGKLSLYSSIYEESGTIKHSEAARSGARMVMAKGTSGSDFAISFQSSQSYAHAVDATASMIVLGTVLHDGSYRMGPSTGLPNSTRHISYGNIALQNAATITADRGIGSNIFVSADKDLGRTTALTGVGLFFSPVASDSGVSAYISVNQAADTASTPADVAWTLNGSGQHTFGFANSGLEAITANGSIVAQGSTATGAGSELRLSAAGGTGSPKTWRMISASSTYGSGIGANVGSLHFFNQSDSIVAMRIAPDSGVTLGTPNGNGSIVPHNFYGSLRLNTLQTGGGVTRTITSPYSDYGSLDCYVDIITNIGTTDVPLCNDIGALFQGIMHILISTFAGHTTSFTIYGGVQSSVLARYTVVGGANATITEPSEGVFNINISGDGRTYTLTLHTSSAKGSLRVDTAVTGLTYVKILRFR